MYIGKPPMCPQCTFLATPLVKGMLIAYHFAILKMMIIVDYCLNVCE